MNRVKWYSVKITHVNQHEERNTAYLEEDEEDVDEDEDEEDEDELIDMNISCICSRLLPTMVDILK